MPSFLFLFLGLMDFYFVWKMFHNATHTHTHTVVLCCCCRSFFSVFWRCCRPWLHCCELCAHLSYGFIICCSLLDSRNIERLIHSEKNAMFRVFKKKNVIRPSASLIQWKAWRANANVQVRWRIILDVDFHYMIYFILSI